jgi:rhodanese-related sulfurtransferase
MSMKLLVDPATDAILGAQVVGGEGVDKRIDVIAVAMAGGIPASGLARLELAYAPQFGSAKDPVNQLGYVADNLRTDTTRTIQWHELDAALDAGATIVDVRSPAEHEAGGIPGAVNISVDELRDRLTEIPDGPVVVHCAVGQRGHTAARILSQRGFDVVNLDGGYRTWLAGTRAQGVASRPERAAA